jgi:hypothetical protein
MYFRPTIKEDRREVLDMSSLYFTFHGEVRFTVCGAQSNACEVEKNLLQAHKNFTCTWMNTK